MCDDVMLVVVHRIETNQIIGGTAGLQTSGM
jgi:hypothetical protein